MNTTNPPDEIDCHRRRFFGAAAMTIAAAQFGVSTFANARSTSTPTSVLSIKSGTKTSFTSLKQIDAGLLSVGYAEDGPSDGPPVLLLHGWTYDIHSYVEVAPLLASEGYRVIVPYLRGYGTTRFIASDTFRNGQQNYRWRIGIAEGESKYQDLEERLAKGSVISVPTITLEGDANGAPHAPPAAYRKKFSGKYEHRDLAGGVGHNLPQEAPKAFAQAVLDVARVSN